ncbi:peptide chain release factor N(5)-glutamine methyltransferase [Verrucomicrobiota bacterium]
MRKVREYLRWMESDFDRAGVDGPTYVARDLMAHALGCSRPEVLIRADDELTMAQQHRLERMAALAQAGEPIQYVIGEVDFREVTLKVDRRALIPRPETELLVGEVMAAEQAKGLPDLFDRPSIVDVGTGSGCIVISLAKEFPSGIYTAVDVSEDALALAQENAELNHVKDRIRWSHSSLLDGFDPESMDFVVSNPPYITTDVCGQLDRAVREFEPMSALDGGADGLILIRTLVEQAKSVLVPGGWIMMEMGYDQGPALKELLESQGYEEVQIKKDLAGLDRMALGRNPQV